MKVYLIKLKFTPASYIGKKHISYAFMSDKNIEYQMTEGYCKNKTVKETVKHMSGYHLVPRKKAKLWDDPKNIKWLYTYTGKYTDDEDDYKEKISTFSQYEVEIDDNGKITCISLDDFVKLRHK